MTPDFDTLTQFHGVMTSNLPHKWGPERARRLFSIIGGLVGVTAMVAACSSTTDDASGSSGSGLTTVTVALDYLPSPSHSGIAYAMQEGLFAEQRIELKILPYGATAPETLVAAGKADIGLSSGSMAAIPILASGAPVKSIFVSSTEPYKVGVLADSGIERPADLAGKSYGGYGIPVEAAMIDAMIKNDGGSGEVKDVVLNVGAYEALTGGQVDSVLAYRDQEYQNELNGIDMKSFDVSEYGVPEGTGLLVLANDGFLEKNGPLVEGFVAALQAGYQAAIDDPAAATQALIAQFPGEVNEEVADYVGDVQAKELLPNAFGPVGTQDLAQWQAAADWLAAQGLLVDASGKTLSSFDVTPYVTNEYLPQP